MSKKFLFNRSVFSNAKGHDVKRKSSKLLLLITLLLQKTTQPHPQLQLTQTLQTLRQLTALIVTTAKLLLRLSHQKIAQQVVRLLLKAMKLRQTMTQQLLSQPIKVMMNFPMKQQVMKLKLSLNQSMLQNQQNMIKIMMMKRKKKSTNTKKMTNLKKQILNLTTQA